jgi:hypothetical protein
VAGARWSEDCFAEAKSQAGLDRYQVRKYRAWYRHATLSMLACAFGPKSATVALGCSSELPRFPGPGNIRTGTDGRRLAIGGYDCRAV